MGAGAAPGLLGVEFGAAPPGEPGSLHRLERGGTAAQHSPDCLQHAVSDSAVGPGAALGIAPARPHGAPALAGLGAYLWAPYLFLGNICGPRTVSRDLLPGCQLGGVGTNHGTGQGRSDAPPEPVAERGVGIPAHTTVSPVFTRGRGMRLSGSEDTPRLDVSTEELEALVEQARAVLPEGGYQKLLGAVHTLRYVTELLEKKEASLANLLELLCPATTEKTEKVLKQAGIDSGPEKSSTAGPEPRAPKRRARGHGRNGAAMYSGAQRVQVPH